MAKNKNRAALNTSARASNGMKAYLKNYRQSPRKVSLVASLIQGKKVSVARQQLAFLPKRAAPAVAKLLDSAIANARSTGATVEELFVKSITVNKGAMQKRYRPFARGRSGTIRKTTSHVAIELGRNQVSGGREQVSGKKSAKTKKKQVSKNLEPNT